MAEVEEMLTVCECQAASNHSHGKLDTIVASLQWQGLNPGCHFKASEHFNFGTFQILHFDQENSRHLTDCLFDWDFKIQDQYIWLFALFRPRAQPFLHGGNLPSRLCKVRIPLVESTWASRAYLSAFVDNLPPQSHTLILLDEFVCEAIVVGDHTLVFLYPSLNHLQETSVVFHPRAWREGSRVQSLIAVLLGESTTSTNCGSISGRQILCYPCLDPFLFNRQFLRLTPTTFLLEVESSQDFRIPVLFQIKADEYGVSLTARVISDVSLWDIRNTNVEDIKFGNLAINPKLVDSDIVGTAPGFGQEMGAEVPPLSTVLEPNTDLRLNPKAETETGRWSIAPEMERGKSHLNPMQETAEVATDLSVAQETETEEIPLSVDQKPERETGAIPVNLVPETETTPLSLEAEAETETTPVSLEPEAKMSPLSLQTETSLLGVEPDTRTTLLSLEPERNSKAARVGQPLEANHALEASAENWGSRQSPLTRSEPEALSFLDSLMLSSAFPESSKLRLGRGSVLEMPARFSSTIGIVCVIWCRVVCVYVQTLQNYATEKVYDFCLGCNGGSPSLDELFVLRKRTDMQSLKSEIVVDRLTKQLRFDRQFSFAGFPSTSSVYCLSDTTGDESLGHSKKLCFASESVDRTPIGRTVLMGIEPVGDCDHEYDATNFPGLDFDNYTLLIACHNPVECSPVDISQPTPSEVNSLRSSLVQVTPNEIRVLDYFTGKLTCCFDFMECEALPDENESDQSVILNLALNAKKDGVWVAALFEDQRLRLFELRSTSQIEELPTCLSRSSIVISWSFVNRLLFLIEEVESAKSLDKAELGTESKVPKADTTGKCIDLSADSTEPQYINAVRSVYGPNTCRVLSVFSPVHNTYTHVFPLLQGSIVQRNLLHTHFRLCQLVQDVGRQASDRSQSFSANSHTTISSSPTGLTTELQQQFATLSMKAVALEVMTSGMSPTRHFNDAVLYTVVLFATKCLPTIWTLMPATLILNNEYSRETPASRELCETPLSCTDIGPIPVYDSKCIPLELWTSHSTNSRLLFLIIPPSSKTDRYPPFLLLWDLVEGVSVHSLDLSEMDTSELSDLSYFKDSPESLFTITHTGEIGNFVADRVSYQRGSFVSSNVFAVFPRHDSETDAVGDDLEIGDGDKSDLVPIKLAMHGNLIAVALGKRISSVAALLEILNAATDSILDPRASESAEEMLKLIALWKERCELDPRDFPTNELVSSVVVSGAPVVGQRRLELPALESVMEVQFLNFGDDELVLAIGTSLNLLGFAAPKGRLWVCRYPHFDGSTELDSTHFAKYTIAGAVCRIGHFRPTTVSEGDGKARHFIYYSGGAKMYLQELSFEAESDAALVTGGSFYECKSTITDIQPIKNYFLISTAEHGCEFIMFRITPVKTPTSFLPLSLVRLASSLCPRGMYLPILSGVSIVLTSQLGFVTSDPFNNVVLMKFLLSSSAPPDDEDSLNESAVLHHLDAARLPTDGAVLKWLPAILNAKEQVCVGMVGDGSFVFAKFMETEEDKAPSRSMPVLPFGVNKAAAYKPRGPLKFLWSDSIPGSLVIDV
eukprot:Gregarina_sp_Poly_1__9954@NODE_658_length_6911_cov_118_518703_g500_i0_p1_GENE_NODE_658_length_6911_cov_118_518703_g500_i0NODE_658_length_6911_cov_118_518703_g500_i0_p1_ORF_typecomplete_len1823_score254_09CPSF_A/PF03178_15/1e07_NODE_658_length_6911_cov_118_518703_g500_i014436125